jgi:hypothetical protein
MSPNPLLRGTPAPKAHEPLYLVGSTTWLPKRPEGGRPGEAHLSFDGVTTFQIERLRTSAAQPAQLEDKPLLDTLAGSGHAPSRHSGNALVRAS